MTNDPLGTFRHLLTHGIAESSHRRRRRRLAVGVATMAVVAVIGGRLIAARPDTHDLLVAGGPSSTARQSPGPSTSGPPSDDPVCQVTRPAEPGLSVPSEWPKLPPSGVWYGTADLWTVLPVDGSSPTPRKSVWWSANFLGGSVEPEPDIAVTWQRLDKSDPPIRQGSPGTNAAAPELGSFMIAGIDPPGAGCWEVTASYRGTTLSYVYWNPPHLWVNPSRSAAPNGEARNAVVEGNVDYDETNNCYFLVSSARLRFPVVWPSGTTVARSGSTITLTDRRTIRLGDHIAGRGGYVSVKDEVDQLIPAACVPRTGKVAVFGADAVLSLKR